MRKSLVFCVAMVVLVSMIFAGCGGNQAGAKEAVAESGSAETDAAATADESTETDEAATADESAKTDAAATADGSTETDEGTAADGSAQTDEAAAADGSGEKEDVQVDMAAITGEGMIKAFIDEPFYDGVIETNEDAEEAVKSVFDRIGADETTVLTLAEIRPTEDKKYYTFYQIAGATRVYGAAVKLVVDENGKADGLISAIVPNLPSAIKSTSITAEEAEAVVEKQYKDKGLNVVKGATEETLLPAADTSDLKAYTWVVYTNNPYTEFDTAYLAHYVAEDGEYLAAIPISEPGNSDALGGAVAEFAFDKQESATWDGTVLHYDGNEEEISVPVLIDNETGKTILGDGKRRILCADYNDFVYGGTLTPRTSDNGEWDNNELLVYYNMIRIYDLFSDIGWIGPDGSGTPMLLLMNMVDEKGNPIDNAYYAGRSKGFEVFQIGNVVPYGDCIDVLAHEYTHCVTSSTMTTNIFKNDMGAINEGMSDVIGNIAEMMLSDDEAGYWLLGEKSGKILRSMSDPNQYNQPSYTWDIYYVPNAKAPSKDNDTGGSHLNSSLLNIISYRLSEAGMAPDEQNYFWMNVALAMTPATDYPQMAELLPWCIKEAGYPQYEDALLAAIKEARYIYKEVPETVPDGRSMAVITPDEKIEEEYEIKSCIMNLDIGKFFYSWPEAESGKLPTVLPEGNYLILMICTSAVDEEVSSYICNLSGEWEKTGTNDLDEIYTAYAGEYPVTLTDGDLLELDFSIPQ